MKKLYKYDVELIMRRRIKTMVEAPNKEEAFLMAQDIYDAGDISRFNELILGPLGKAKRLK